MGVWGCGSIYSHTPTLPHPVLSNVSMAFLKKNFTKALLVHNAYKVSSGYRQRVLYSFALECNIDEQIELAKERIKTVDVDWDRIKNELELMTKLEREKKNAKAKQDIKAISHKLILKIRSLELPSEEKQKYIENLLHFIQETSGDENKPILLNRLD